MGYLPSEMYSLALSHLQRVTTMQDKSQGLCELPKMGQEGLVHNEAQMTPLPSLPISAVWSQVWREVNINILGVYYAIVQEV